MGRLHQVMMPQLHLLQEGYMGLIRTSVFNGQGIDEKKVQEMPRIVDEEEEVANGPSNFEEELQMRELKIAS
jgi:hypothetical protein